MGTRKKSAVLGVFMLAGFVVVASVVRIVMLQRNREAIDPVWSIAYVFKSNLWIPYDITR
jgi:hypothetical protein